MCLVGFDCRIQSGVHPYPILQLFPDERFEQCPDHVENEWLLDDVHFLHSERDGLLDERQQKLREGW